MWRVLVALVVVVSACADEPGSAGDLPVTDAVPDAGVMADAGVDVDVDVADAGTDPVPDAGPSIAADPYFPAPPPPPLSETIKTEIARDVADVLASFRGRKTVRIENLDTGQVVLEVSPNTALIPASNTKLFTTAAAHAFFGDDDELVTRVHADVAPDASGVVRGDLYVVGDHDFSASRLFFDATQDTVDRLAEQLYDAGVRQVTGRVRVRGEFVFGGSSIGELDVASHRRAYVSALTSALSGVGIAHAGVVAETASDAPAGKPRLLERSPIPLWVGAYGINVPSHNEFADLLARRMGQELGGGVSTEAAGAAQAATWFRGLAPASQGFALGDGSGLSRTNRASGADIVRLLKHMDTAPGGLAWRRGLAIAGVRGTIGGRMTGSNTRGRVFGKTGTLEDVVALSGYLEHAQDGQRYAFAIVFNDVADISGARAIADGAVNELAKPRRIGPARLSPPNFRSFLATGQAGFARLAWEAVPGANGYVVWFSEDCEHFLRTDARLVNLTSFTAGELGSTTPTCARVTALGPDGYESDPSVTLVATASDRPVDLLLVDGNDRWLSQPSPENHLRRPHDFLLRLGRALPTRAVESVHHGEVSLGRVPFDRYGAVLWASGEQSEADGTFTASEQAAIAAYLAAGGGVLLSGAELLWDLYAMGSAEDRTFATTVLRTGYVDDDANTWEARGLAGTPFATLPALTFQSPDGMEIQYPDVLSAASGAQALVEYVGGRGGAAVVGARAAGASIVTGFPVESIANERDLAQFLTLSLAYLGAGSP